MDARMNLIMLIHVTSDWTEVSTSQRSSPIHCLLASAYSLTDYFPRLITRLLLRSSLVTRHSPTFSHALTLHPSGPTFTDRSHNSPPSITLDVITYP